jgi:hypothetical protein
VDDVRMGPRITGNNLHPQLDVITTTIQAADAAQTPLIVKGAPGQTVPHFEVRNVNDEGLFAVDDIGVAYAARLVTTGNNVVNKTDPAVADLVLGSDLGGGFRHNANMLLWNTVGALRLVSNADDSLSLSSWSATLDGTRLPGANGGNAILTGPVAVHKNTAPNCSLDVAGWGRFGASNDIPVDNINAIEIFFYQSGGWGGILTYNRGTNTYLPMHIEASAIDLYIAGKPTLAVQGGAFTFYNNTTVSSTISLSFWALPSTGTAVPIGQQIYEFADATRATWKSRTRMTVQSYNGSSEGLRIESTGFSARIGFFGAAAVDRPTVTGSRGGNAALTSLLTALANLGLIINSSSA